MISGTGIVVFSRVRRPTYGCFEVENVVNFFVLFVVGFFYSHFSPFFLINEVVEVWTLLREPYTGKLTEGSNLHALYNNVHIFFELVYIYCQMIY